MSLGFVCWLHQLPDRIYQFVSLLSCLAASPAHNTTTAYFFLRTPARAEKIGKGKIIFVAYETRQV